MSLDALFDDLSARGPAWLWFGIGMRNGDMHHAAAFARAFRRTHGDDLPIRLVVSTLPQEMVARVWEDAFDSIETAPDLRVEEAEIREFFVRRRLPFFGPGVPLLLHPRLSPRTSSLNAFASENRLIWGQLYKNALDLPGNCEPAPPPLRPERGARARDLLAATGLPPGRTMLLFPFAQSLPVEALGHFAKLAADATAQGWTVATSVAPGEEPVAGTKGVFIPFDILLECADEAGWVVAVRSGICDITATSHARRTFIFRERNELPVWGVDALELARDARQIVFRFDAESPRRFSERVLGQEEDHAPVPRRTLSDMAVEGQAAAERVSGTIDEVETLRGRLKGRLFKGKPSLIRIVDVPARDHPRRGEKATGACDALVDMAARDARFYACRDSALGLDYFEEVDVGSLKAGRYAAAATWHTLMATDAAGLCRLLPDALHGKVLDRTVYELGHFQHIGQSFATKAHLALVTGDRPVDLGGVQLLSGWFDLEPWGLWSQGDVSVLKFSVAQPPTQPVTLELEGRLIVTQADGVLHLRVRVNGVEVLARDVERHENVNLRVTIPPELMRTRTAYVEFVHPHARSPARLSEGGDTRRLSLGLVSVNLRHGA